MNNLGFHYRGIGRGYKALPQLLSTAESEPGNLFHGTVPGTPAPSSEDDDNLHRPPAVCNYEGSDYQTTFLGAGRSRIRRPGRSDRPAAACCRPQGRLLLELGAGAGATRRATRASSASCCWIILVPNCSQATQRLGAQRALHLRCRGYLPPAFCSRPVRCSHHDPHPAPHGRCPAGALARCGRRCSLGRLSSWNSPTSKI